jgi:hypothetical protein
LHRLGSILSQLKLPGPGPLQLRQLQDAIAGVFGVGAAGLRLSSFRRGRLVIEVESAARAFELQAFARGALLARLKAMPGLEQLTEVAFKNGAWKVHGRQ